MWADWHAAHREVCGKHGHVAVGVWEGVGRQPGRVGEGRLDELRPRLDGTHSPVVIVLACLHSLQKQGTQSPYCHTDRCVVLQMTTSRLCLGQDELFNQVLE